MKRILRCATIIAACLVAATACRAPVEDSGVDMIVVGGGIAGLSAALEMGRGGARVLILDMNSVPGGHGIRAAGFTLVDTPVQRRMGIEDSPDLAYGDLMAWGETNNPEWTRTYVENSRTMVYDWLTELGVEFVVAVPTPENSVPRFHFTRGTAANAVIPLLQAVLEHPDIEFMGNWSADDIIVENGRVQGVAATNLRSGEKKRFTARGVVIATGGYQANLELVRETWRPDMPYPENLKIGSSPFSLGGGLDLAQKAGAALTDLHKQMTFVSGIPDPRNEEGNRALTTDTGTAIWVNSDGVRFIDENSANKFTIPTVLQLNGSSFWAVFDETGKQHFDVRDAMWLTPEAFETEIIGNPAITSIGQTPEELAAAAGLPADALAATIKRYNAYFNKGEDTEFGRIKPGLRLPPEKIETPPFYAVQVYPVTRKSMGGIAIDMDARALDGDGAPVPGLYAAGEVTGVAGVNGSMGMSGTFLAPSVLTGRTAARAALGDLGIEPAAEAEQADAASAPDNADVTWQPDFTREDLADLVGMGRAGYWHFETAHELVLERNFPCTMCHSAQMPMQPAATRPQFVAQAAVCSACHR